MFQKLLSLGEDRPLKEFSKIVDAVNDLEDQTRDLDDVQLAAKTVEFRQRLADGETLDEIEAEAFAVVREAAQRVIGQRHFDVQILGAAALHAGMVAEMKTGEGKTLASTMPAYLNALSGEGVHMVTVNEYLASRDAEWMGQIHRFLGLEVGLVTTGMTPEQKRAAYAADITYGTNNEFGFDYLRDNMATSPAEQVQGSHPYAIIDEVDSILVDEARTPLIISGVVTQEASWYTKFSRIAAKLRPEEEYEVDIQKRQVLINEEGVARVEQILGVENLYDHTATDLVHHLEAALRAKELFKRDVDYLVDGGQVKIVDEFTGRVLEGRRYSEGLHQAIEAKEGVQIQAENQTLATITLQNYFRMYDKLAGMTGTAETEAAELASIYDLEVAVIPTNRPLARVDQGDLIYKTEQAKFEAVVADVAERHANNQPVLLGTISIERSEVLSEMLAKTGVKHEVLNAKHHAREAEIIAQAGRPGAVTVATNMAGRGVDIMLGGNPEGKAEQELKRRGVKPEDDSYDDQLEELTASYEKALAGDRQTVLDAGGLYVVGTERHDSRRIDNQLRGRSGRQGDPGESRFYLSLEDDLMRRFQSEWVSKMLERLSIPDDQPIEAKTVTKAIERAQRQVESQNFEIRKDVLKYDEVMNTQREHVYRWRDTVLEGFATGEQVGEGVTATELISNTDTGPEEEAVDGDSGDRTAAEMAEDWIVEVVTGVVEDALAGEKKPGAGRFESLARELETLYQPGVDWEGLRGAGRDAIVDEVVDDALARYEEREAELGADMMRRIERSVMLAVIDNKWRDHLADMDYMRAGIGLRGMGQKDPLVEYQNEAYGLFVDMVESVKYDTTRYLYHVEVVTDPKSRQSQLTTSSTEGAKAPEPAKSEKVGRNEPCPCGSGKKYKRCHGAV